MQLYLVDTDAGPALCKYAYLQAWQLTDRPERYLAFGGHLARLHAAQYLQARFPALWPLAHIQVAALIKGRAHYHLLTVRPRTFGPTRRIRPAAALHPERRGRDANAELPAAMMARAPHGAVTPAPPEPRPGPAPAATYCAGGDRAPAPWRRYVCRTGGADCLPRTP
jgi:hypothetical protein